MPECKAKISGLLTLRLYEAGQFSMSKLRICFRLHQYILMSCLGKKEMYFAHIRFTQYFFCTERIKHNTDKPGIMSDVEFCKYSGSDFHSTCEAYRSFYTELFTYNCDRVLIDAVQQCRYRYILQLRRYCSVYFYEREVPKK